jgi:hypothetical protein
MIPLKLNVYINIPHYPVPTYVRTSISKDIKLPPFIECKLPNFDRFELEGQISYNVNGGLWGDPSEK